jgi:hypothetical protein
MGQNWYRRRSPITDPIFRTVEHYGFCLLTQAHLVLRLEKPLGRYIWNLDVKAKVHAVDAITPREV